MMSLRDKYAKSIDAREAAEAAQLVISTVSGWNPYVLGTL